MIEPPLPAPERNEGVVISYDMGESARRAKADRRAVLERSIGMGAAKRRKARRDQVFAKDLQTREQLRNAA